jgi:hypothetical protein
MQQQPQYAPSPPTNTMAVVSLVSGIVAWFILPLLAAIVAIITGHMARNEIRNSHGMQGGDALALIGLILGYLNLVVSCIVPILVLGGFVGLGSICAICGAITESTGFEASGVIIPPIPLN